MGPKKLEVHKMTYPGDDTIYWGITAEEVNKCLFEGKTPQIVLPNKSGSSKPIIGILFAKDRHPDRKEKDYSIHPDYVEAILKSGGQPQFITYSNIENQLENVDAILLPGGAFNSPPEWYTKPQEHYRDPIDKRSIAYIRSVAFAIQNKMPTFGICAGHQMIAGMLKAKMIDKINVNVPKEKSHKQPSKYILSHSINIVKGSQLHKLVGETKYMVNSSHNEAVTNSFSMFDGTADFRVTAQDEKGGIEAIEPKEPWNEFAIGVQYHPECMAHMGDSKAKNMFKVFTKEAYAFSQNKNLQKKEKSGMAFNITMATLQLMKLKKNQINVK